MTGAARFWLRLGSEIAVATALFLLAGFAARDPSVSALVGAGGGFVIGLSLFMTIERTWRPPLGAIRLRPAVLALSSLVLLLRSASEEIFWRWFVLGSLAIVTSVWAAAGISTVAFALAHVEPRAVGIHLVTGSALALAYALTGSLVGVVAAHATYNILVALGVQQCRRRTHGGESFHLAPR